MSTQKNQQRLIIGNLEDAGRALQDAMESLRAAAELVQQLSAFDPHGVLGRANTINRLMAEVQELELRNSVVTSTAALLPSLSLWDKSPVDVNDPNYAWDRLEYAEVEDAQEWSVPVNLFPRT